MPGDGESEGTTPLMYACQQGNEKECEEILRKKRGAARQRDRTQKTALHYCVENVNTSCADALLKAAPEGVNARDEDGYSPLHLAVIAGNKPMIQLLTTRGADINALDHEKHSVVHWATVCGEEEALEMVLRAGASISCPDIHGGFPLHYAAQMCGPGADVRGDSRTGLAILRTLLAYGADVDARDKDGRQPILWAASAGSADAILALVKAGAKVESADKDGLTALHCAASRGHTECLETLVALCGAHVDTIDINGCTALFYAATLGHADATQLLLNLGAEPNRQDRKGRTPAHCGAAKGQLETLRILLSGGANLWLRNVKGDLPLHEAVASGRRELVSWLLNQRVESVNVANNDGKCPIHVAAINNNVEIIKVLLDAGSLVNPVLRNNKGEMLTPLDAGLLRGHRSTAKFLQLHGGVPSSKLTDASLSLRGTMSNRENEFPLNNLQATRVMFPALPLSERIASERSAVRLGPDDVAIRQIERIPVRLAQDQEGSEEERRQSRKKLRRKKGDRRKPSEESTSDDSELSSNSSRHHRKSSRRRKSKEDSKDKSEKLAENKAEAVAEDNIQVGEINKACEMTHSETLPALSATESPPDVQIVQIQEPGIQPVSMNVVEQRDDPPANPQLFETTNYEEQSNTIETKLEMSEKAPENGDINESIAAEIPVTNASLFNLDSSLDDTTLPVSETLKIEAEVHQHQPSSDSPEITEENAKPEEAVDESPIPQRPEPLPEQEIIIHAANSDPTAEGIPVEPENSVDIVDEDANNEELENCVDENVGKVEDTEIKPPLLHLSSTETVSSPGEDDSTMTRPVTARRRSIVPPPAPEELPLNEDVAFYKLDDTLGTERRSADGSEGLGEENKPSLNVRAGRRSSFVFGEPLERGRSSRGRRRKSDGGESRAGRGRRGHFDTDNFERDVCVPEPDIDTVIKNVLLAESHHSEPSCTWSHYDDSSNLPDSGIEPSPRPRRSSQSQSPSPSRRFTRFCQRGKAVSTPVSVTRTVQSTIRKYHLERKIFYQLLELKRLQIRAGRANEQVLVKRLVDDYQTTSHAAGLTMYAGNFSFRQFERFLYDQLHHLQSGRHVRKIHPADDIQALSEVLKKSRGVIQGAAEDECAEMCTHITHRCRHATHAYTGIPCAAYITKLNHHTMPKQGFLPRISLGVPDGTRRVSGRKTAKICDRPVTLEVINGREKQVISLPTDHLDRSKRYFVTFSIKGGGATPPREGSPLPAGHLHAKTV